MMTDVAYAQKITQKQRLAAELGLRLYLIGPTDVLQLGTLLADEVFGVTERGMKLGPPA